MEIRIPKVIRKLPLKEYVAEFGEATLEVWVNPPRGLIMQMINAMEKARLSVVDLDLGKELSAEQKKVNGEITEALLTEQLEVAAEVLSQGGEESRLNVSAMRKLVEETFETDPAFWHWLRGRLLTMIMEHRNLSKKG